MEDQLSNKNLEHVENSSFISELTKEPEFFNRLSDHALLVRVKTTEAD